MTRDRRSRSGDEGVTIVEAAFALPILLMFVFGLVDLGMWAFNSNQATNAARDGARAAILSFEQLDVGNSTDQDRVVDAVESRLDRSVDLVSMDCVDPDGDVIACSQAEVDVDSVRVAVEWDWQLITPVAAVLGYDDGRASGSATMAIVGRPFEGPPGVTTTSIAGTTSTTATIPAETTTTTTATACSASSLTVSPLTIKTTGNGSNQLVDELSFTFKTNGSPLCTDLRVLLISPQDNGSNDKRETFKCGCGTGPTNYAGSYRGSTNIWGDTGTNWRAVLMNGTQEFETKTFAVVDG